MRKTKIFYGDFETTQPNEKFEVRCYLWCIVSDKIKKYGESIESFIKFCESLKGKNIIYFHNLRFDFSYMEYYLILNNIKYEKLEKNNIIYSVRFYNIELRDSLNFLQMTLKEIGENYCTIYKKTKIEHIADFSHKPTQEEIEYCFNDCFVLKEGLEVYFATLEEVLKNAGCIKTLEKIEKRLTNAGIAFEAFKELSDFELLCPKTTQEEYINFLSAYKGGYVFSNICGKIENVQMIDCNSMYPYMYSTIDMPYGYPIFCNNEEELKNFKFGIIAVFIRFELKEGYIPIIGGGFNKNGSIHYDYSSEGMFKELVISTIDFELIKEFYDIEYDLMWGVGFNTKPNFFKKYAETFIELKNKSKGVVRNVAKVLLNSPYGKTAMNGEREIKRTFIDEKGVLKNEVVGYELEKDKYQYLPIAIAITANARKYLLNTAKEIGFENVIYMDTDSIKFKNKKTNIKMDPNILGAWKDEGLCKIFKTIAPKKYIYLTQDNVIHIACAGFNRDIIKKELKDGEKVNEEEALQIFNKFEKGLKMECLQSKIVTGGRALIPVLKEIK